MKTIGKVAAAIAIAALHWCVTAATVEVATVAELTNAVARANAGEKIGGEAINTIMLKSGIYAPSAGEFMLDDGSVKSFLDVQVGNFTITGEDESPRKMWTSGSEPVVIDMGNIGRFVQHTKGGLMVKNIAVTGSRIASGYGTIVYGANQWQTPSIFTNCVFRQNAGTLSAFWAHFYRLDDCAYVANSCVLNGYLRGCDIHGNTGPMQYIHCMYDCSVEGHVRTDFNPIVLLLDDVVVSNCTFKANSVGNCKSTNPLLRPVKKATIVDCIFEANTNVLIGANLDDTDASLINVTGCTFVSNAVTAGVEGTYIAYLGYLILNNTNNFASAAAAQARFSVSDSTFDGSCYGTIQWNLLGLAEVFGVHASRCTFGGHSADTKYDWNYYNMSALNSSLEDCDIMGGDITDCVVNRCTIHDVTNRMFACFRDYCRVTNSLVFNFSPANYASLYAAVFKQDAEFVNCTFATNSARTYYSRLSSDACGDLKFVNCLFNSNVRAGNPSVASDISAADNDSSVYVFTQKVAFASSYYGKFTPYGSRFTDKVFAALTNAPNSLAVCANPKFVKNSRPEAPYWSLLPSSPILGKGDASIWTAEDVDLVGNLRLRDGKVDPGCYQCWLNPLGFSIIFR